MWKYCKNIVIIYTDFNLNVLLQLFFSLSKQIFFSPILTNNNLPLKMYCENIVTVFLNFNFLFFILCFSYFILFFYPYFLLFFSSTHVPLLFFFFISLFPLLSYHFLHTGALTFLLFFLSLAFFATTSHSRTFHTVSAPLSSLKVFASFFFFFTIRKLQGSEQMVMMMMKMIET